MKKTIVIRKFLCMLCAALAGSLYGGGKRDITEIPISSAESWNETVDTSAKKKGKYNVLITARDVAGNIGYAGPFNVYIDPASDLPLAYIASPVSGSTVSGSINLVGTAVDDDGIASVEVSVDGLPDVYIAKGKEFWSYSLNTAGMAEGTHTVTVTPVDINGLRGKSVKSIFYLNQQQPVTNIENKSAGVLVSGMLKLSGTVEDGNGIERLFYSLDNGTAFNEVKLSHNKKANISEFKLDLNTEKIADGPNVCWFKAVDKRGSVGIYTFLFFVDNIPPVLSFIHPVGEKESMPSVFSVAGKAVDGTGLESLKWVCGKESGDIPITPGNQYWVKEFDFSKNSAASANIEVIATDVAGNIVRLKKQITIDKAKDKPTIELISPKPDSINGGDVFIAGLSCSPTPIKELRWRIDKGEEKTLNTDCGAFGVTETGLTAGAHTLSIYAVTESGIGGSVQTLKFFVRGKEPLISFENGKTVIPLYRTDNRASSAVRVVSETGLKEVVWSINGAAETQGQIRTGQTEYLLKTGINEKTAPGLYTIVVKAEDTAGVKTEQSLLIGVPDSSNAAETTEFLWSKKTASGSGYVLLEEGAELNGVYYSGHGTAADNVELIAPEGISCRFDGNTVTLQAVKSGLYKDVRIKITDAAGTNFESSPIDILADFSAPAVQTVQSDDPLFVTDSLSIAGSVSDDTAVESVDYAVFTNGTEALMQGVLNTPFEQRIDISSIPDGPLFLEIRARDTAQKESFIRRAFLKDTEAPEAVMVSPADGDTVNGSITAAFKVTERFGRVKAAYTSGGAEEHWQEIPASSLPNIVIGSAAEPISEKMRFKFTDSVGNERIIDKYGFEIDSGDDAPVVELHLPFENEVIFKDFALSGMIYDDDAAARIYYKVDDGAYQAVEATHSFTIPFQLSDFTDNEHRITVYGEDIYGVKSEPVERKIRVSLEPPAAEMLTPVISETVKGLITITGTVSDKNGVKEVQVSVNNGNVFCNAEGAEEWSYTVNTNVIGDGTHVVFIKAVDNYGLESVSSSLINIDNTPPSLKIEYPLAGSVLDSDLFVSGQTHDNIQLEGVALKIKSLSGTAVPENLSEIKLSTNLVVAEDINIAALPEGLYNLEISGIDKAGNISQAAVNFDVRRKNDKDKIELLYPLNGENLCGEFNIYGRIDTTSKIKQVFLFIDGQQTETADVSTTGYVFFKINQDVLSEGAHTIELKGILPDDKLAASGIYSIIYKTSGPWITIDNLQMGDFAVDRPYLRGRAGYVLSAADNEALSSKQTGDEAKSLLAAKRLKSVEVSFNNGKTFAPAKTGKDWRFRIETEDMPEGNHFLLVRAVMENKEVAICRTIIKIDKQVPNISLIAPGEGGRYNAEMTFTGLASDDTGLQSTEAALRKGDKSTYGVPKFIQGLHVETGFWGATLWNMGFGLSFFDNNVKIQFHYGQFTQKQFDAIRAAQNIEAKPIRYGGDVASIKLLANIFEQPFGYYFGPDWRWLYLNVALGAQFSLFSQTQSGRSQVLSAVLTQIEFPRIKLYKRKYLSSVSLFTEGQLWFIPTDVNAASIKSVIPHISGGVRVSFF